jgi:transcriptional regulator with XRE-family HTH domain
VEIAQAGHLLLSDRSAHQHRGPAVARIMLGTQLRRLRQARGLTTEAAGHAIRASHTKISRMERGRGAFTQREVAELLALYGITDQGQRGRLLTLAGQANAAEWAHHYRDLLPSWGQTYLGLEQASSVIRTYQPQLVPDLLQIEEVTRDAVRLLHPNASTLDIQRRVALQMTRQQILTRPDAPRLWAVIDQAALWRLVDCSALRAQIQHLITMVQLPHITVQMLPVYPGEHVAIDGPLTILRFAEPEIPDIAHVQHQTTAVYLDRDEDVQPYRTLMDRLCVLAVSPAQTINYLSAILENPEMTHRQAYLPTVNNQHTSGDTRTNHHSNTPTKIHQQGPHPTANLPNLQEIE